MSRDRRYLLIFLIPASFFFLLNLFSELEGDLPLEIWFQWPSLAIGLIVALLWLRRRR